MTSAVPRPVPSHTRSATRCPCTQDSPLIDEGGSTLPGDDDGADRYRDEHRGDGDVESDQREVLKRTEIASLIEAMASSVRTSRLGPPNPRSPAIDSVAPDPTWCSPARIAPPRLVSAGDRGGERRARSPVINSAMPRSNAPSASMVSADSSRSMAAWPRTRPTMHATAVPSRNPARNAMPLCAGARIAPRRGLR